MAANPIQIIPKGSANCTGLHVVNGGNADADAFLFHDYFPLPLSKITFPYLEPAALEIGDTDAGFKLAILLDNGKVIKMDCAQPESAPTGHNIADGQTAIVKVGDTDVVGTSAYECAEFALKALIDMLNLEQPPTI